MRITADSNIYVSALQFGGKPLRLLKLALDGQIQLTISDHILEETLDVLGNKFGLSSERVAAAKQYIGSCTERVVPALTLNVVPSDPDDNRVLECAVAAHAERIVSGDGDLLRMGSYEGIRIVNVSDFLAGMADHDETPP